MGFVDEMKILFSKEDENLFQEKDFQKIKMTYEELVSRIHSSGMSIKEFKELLNMQPNSITNLKKEGTFIPKLLFTVALLVHKINQLGGNAREVLEPFEFEKIKPKRKSGEKGLFKKKYLRASVCIYRVNQIFKVCLNKIDTPSHNNLNSTIFEDLYIISPIHPI